MNIRYFVSDTDDNLSYSTHIAETNGVNVIPHKKEEVFIGDILYKVVNVCYVTEFKSIYDKEVYIDYVDITIKEIESFK